MDTALSLFFYIENVCFRFEKDITGIQLKALSKVMFKNKICIDHDRDRRVWMSLDVEDLDDIKLMKVI